jgi:broad-specificity NMP kinase
VAVLHVQLIKDEECHEGVDAEFDTLILDEDKFLDVLEPIMAAGGAVCVCHLVLASTLRVPYVLVHIYLCKSLNANRSD